MKERSMLRIALIVGIGMLPLLFRKPGIKKWSVIYITNAVTNHLMDHILVKGKYLKYPVRLVPRVFKINIVYDYFICPLVTILYCQTSYNSKFISTTIQGFLFAIPQVLLEYLSEQKGKIIKYAKGWSCVHSYLGIVAVNLAFRGMTEFIKPETSSIPKAKLQH